MANDVPLTSAMRANLLSLQSTTRLMDRTQLRLATGKAVNEVVDNPAAYFTAEGLMQRSSLLLNRKADISNGIQAINAGNNGIKAIKTSIEQLRSIVTQARNVVGDSGPNGDATRTSLASQYSEVLTQIANIVNDSSFNGVNFLKKDTTLRVAFNESGDAYLDIKGFDATAYGLEIYGSGGKVPTVESEQDAFTPTNYYSHTLTLGPSDTVSVNALTDSTTITFDGVNIDFYGGSTSTPGNYIVTDINGNKSTFTAPTGGGAEVVTYTTKSGQTLKITSTSAPDITVVYGNVTVTADASASDVATTVAVAGTVTDTYTLDTDGTNWSASYGSGTGPTVVATFGAAIAATDLESLELLRQIESSLNDALSKLQDEASKFAGSVGILQTRDDYLKELINTHRTGADKLTQADVNEEAANMLALQTQQQLGLSSLSIASQALQGVLRLFG